MSIEHRGKVRGNQVAIGNHAADPITGRLYDLYCHDCGNKLDESDPAKLDGPGVMCTRCVELYRLLAAARIECVYCNCDVVDRTDESVPSVSDDQAWGDLAKDHGGNCEWIKTRAHQI